MTKAKFFAKPAPKAYAETARKLIGEWESQTLPLLGLLDKLALEESIANAIGAAVAEEREAFINIINRVRNGEK